LARHFLPVQPFSCLCEQANDLTIRGRANGKGKADSVLC
jgi:hypothetical protein